VAAFDMEGALAAGYSKQEIADFLAAEANLDAAAAREHYSDDEIISELTGAPTLANAAPGMPTEPADAPAAPARGEVAVVPTEQKLVVGPTGERSNMVTIPPEVSSQISNYVLNEANKGSLSVEGLEKTIRDMGFEPTNARDVVNEYRKQNAVNPDVRYVPPPVVTPPTDGRGPTAAALGALDVVTMGALPMMAAAGKLMPNAEGVSAVPEGMSFGDAFRRQVDQEQSVLGGYREAAPVWSTLGALGGALVPWGRAPTTAGGMARQGALAGGGYNLGTALSSGASPADVTAQTVLGTTAGGGLGAAFGALRAAVPRELAPAQRVIEGATAAERQKIPLPQTLVSPSAAVRAKELGVSRELVTEAEEAVPLRMGEITDSLAVATGRVAPPEALGRQVQQSAARWLKDQKAQSNKLRTTAEELSDDVVVEPLGVQSVIATELAELSANPKLNKNRIALIGEVADDLEANPLNPKGVRDMRTALWDRLGSADVGLSPSAKSALVTKFTKAATEDVRRTLTDLADETGEQRYIDALGAFEASDKLYRQQSLMTRRVLGEVLGKSADDILDTGSDVWGAALNPEAAVKALRRFSGTKHRSLTALMGTLDDATRNNVKASLIYSLGRTADDTFDPKRFVKELDAIPERTQRTLFGPDGFESLQDLKSVAGLFNDRVGRADTSTYWSKRLGATLALTLGGAGVGALAGAGGMGAGALVGALAPASLMAAQSVTNPIVARMIADPKMARRLAELARAGTPSTRKAKIAALGSYAARVPEFREPVERMLSDLAKLPEVTGKPVSLEAPKPETPTQEEPAQVSTAVDTGFDVDLYKAKLMPVEGTGKNPLSTAVGAYQFIDPTFVNTYRQAFPDEAGLSDAEILAKRGTGVEETMLPVFTQANQRVLSDAGYTPDYANSYLAHFLGADGAVQVLGAVPDTPVTEVVGADAIASNPGVFRKVKTAADLVQWAAEKMGQRT
jgi:hypothetical protein